MTEDFDLKFRAAWEVFASICAESVASEATYQVWLAHYLISIFGINRVAGEPNLKDKHFNSPYREKLRCNEAKLDAAIARSPGIDLPHCVHRESAGEGGIGVLDQLGAFDASSDLLMTEPTVRTGSASLPRAEHSGDMGGYRSEVWRFKRGLFSAGLLGFGSFLRCAE